MLTKKFQRSGFSRSHIPETRMASEVLPWVMMPRKVLLVLVLATGCLLGAASDPSRAGGSIEDVAIPPRSAAQLGLHVGDLLEVSLDPLMRHPRRVRVAVIWDPLEHPADVARRDLAIRFHLPTLETLLGRHDVVDRIIVRLKDPVSAMQVRDELNGIGRGYHAYTATELAHLTSRAFVVISRFHRAIGLITVVASGIFLVTILTLKLTETRREIGALRLMGIGQRTILLTVVGLATATAVIGTAVGIGLGALLVRGINLYYQPRFATHLRFAFMSTTTIRQVVALAILLGVGAGFAVGLRLIRQHPLEQVGR